jgi:hypothetical protein
MKAIVDGAEIESVGEKAVDNAKEIINLRIVEKEKTHRLLIIITAIIIMFASSIMVFAPEGKQETTTIIGVVLIVLSMGSIGASQFSIKALGVEVSTAVNSMNNQGKGVKGKTKSKTDISKENDELEMSKPGYTSAS